MQGQDEDGLIPLADSGVVTPVEAEMIAEAPAVPLEGPVLAEVEKLRNPTGNWAQTLFVLVLSLAVFVALGMRDHPVAFTAMLVGVLFFHELGHYAGMRFFGYRNVRMFFIPLFGAAVSGQKAGAKSYQEAIVTLLGPLPGLCLAPVLVGLGFLPGLDREQRHLMIQAAVLLGFINGFNLLPIFPLDGGRLLNQVLFSRNRHLEIVFLVLAALTLIAFGLAGGGMFLCFLGGWLLVSVNTTFQVNTIARHIEGLLGDQMPQVNESIPLPIFRAILVAVQSRLPGAKTARAMAGFVFRIWEKMHVQPPGALATLGLLLLYLFAIALTVPWMAPFFLHLGKR